MAPGADSYVAEVEGLRAFAVSAVLLFHAFPTVFPGGYIGVDVFFVISGFVISRTYLAALMDGSITLSDFYIRRIRRLAPAYTVVLLATTSAAFLLLEPRMLRNFSNTLLAQPFYLQNFVFWIEGDYFDSAITKPLLHTWSLAVEEQFYLLMGIAVLLLRRWPRLLVPSLLVVTVLSLTLGIFIASSSPKTAFFLLPTRIWEFAFGILAFLCCRIIAVKSGEQWLIFAVYAVLAVLVATVLPFSDVDAFPGIQALVACTATAALCCLFVARPGPSYRPFALPPVRYIGKISYPLYLWHWPLIAFPSILLDRPLGWSEALASLCLSAGLAAVTYAYVELPVRRLVLLGSLRQLLAGLAMASMLFVMAGAIGLVTHGAVFRYSEPVRSLFLAAQEESPYRCGMVFRVLNPMRETCERNQAAGDTALLIIGDSHADILDEMIAELGTHRNIQVLLSVRNCDIDQFFIRSDCTGAVLQRLAEEGKSRGAVSVLLSSYWAGPLQYQRFVRPIEALLKAGLEVTISEVVPHGEFFNPARRAEILLASSARDLLFTKQEYMTQLSEQRAIFERLKTEYGDAIKVLRPAEYLCTDGGCAFETNGSPNYRDESHLSSAGVARLRPLYERYLDSVVSKADRSVTALLDSAP